MDSFPDGLRYPIEVRGEQKGHQPEADVTKSEIPHESWSGTVAREARTAEEEEQENAESPPSDAGWPEDLENELKAFLEAELAHCEGLAGVSNIAEHSIRTRDDKPLKQRRSIPESDDIMVTVATEEQRVANLSDVFRRLKEVSLKLNRKNWSF
ncbi:hypothetical protein AWZ03_014633 [Drosophila navojoa]|uniref:Uncharacterized protein n=1 Tax=Drosophila navojoa TaxID=7232 RepID=A0A484AR97_DRONA|nr:hypothetical protein AWZ03_014633 [Drosophila navojoa]